MSRRYGKGKLIDHDAVAAAAVAEGQPKPKKPKKTRKKLEPAHTAAPHSTDYAHSLLSGETPTSIMEKALKQVTFTAILPGLYTVVEESTKQVAEQCADAALAKTNVAERQRQQSAAAVTSQPSADDDQPKDSGNAEEATERESAADDKPKESGNAKRDSAAEPEAGGPASSNEMQLELYRALRSYSLLTPAERLKSKRHRGEPATHTPDLDRLAADRAYLLS